METNFNEYCPIFYRWPVIVVNHSPVVQWLNAPNAWPGSTSNAPACANPTSPTPGSVPNANLISLNKFKLPLEVGNARVQIPKRFCLRLKLLLLKVSHDQRSEKSANFIATKRRKKLFFCQTNLLGLSKNDLQNFCKIQNWWEQQFVCLKTTEAFYIISPLIFPLSSISIPTTLSTFPHHYLLSWISSSDREIYIFQNDCYNVLKSHQEIHTLSSSIHLVLSIRICPFIQRPLIAL